MKQMLLRFSAFMALLLSAAAGYAQTPGGIKTSLSLWYKADAGITGTTTATGWSNAAPTPVTGSNLSPVGGAGTGPTYNTGTNNPLNQINFNPSISFASNSNQALTTTGALAASVVAPGTNPYTSSQYVVYKVASGATGWLYAHTNNTVGSNNIGASYNQIVLANRPMSLSAATTPNANTVALMDLDGNSNDGGATVNINGIQGASAYSGTQSAPVSGNFIIGGLLNGATPTNNRVAEVVIYTNAVGASRRQIESYLAIKYGITLGTNSSSINYTNSPSLGGGTTWIGNNTYQNNIAGIGQDNVSTLTGGVSNNDASGLLQKQSQSQSLGSNGQIIIGLNTIAVSNAANTGSFAANGNFLIWGDNASSGSSNVALQWQTATETNNKGFYVQRSFDSKIWNDLRFISSKALNSNSSTIIDYNYDDYTPANGINYYRLKQEDMDGAITYSNIISVSFQNSGDIGIYPNPASNAITITGVSGNVAFEIINLNGQIVLTANTNFINVKNISSGVYFVQVVEKNVVVKTIKFVKE